VDDILKRLLEQIDDQYDKTEGYLIYDLLKSAAIELYGQSVKLDSVERLLDVNNLSGELLSVFVEQRKGIKRKEATFAVGDVVVSGNGTIYSGDLFETANGVQFEAIETKVITNNGRVAIRCLVKGNVGNIPVNQIVQMPVTIPGITTVTNPEATHDGYEAESDDSLRDRYYIALRTPPTSGNIYHYLQWAKEISGVGDAKVFPVARGDNTVEVVIINQDKQPASQTLVNEVQNYIDPNSSGLGVGQAPIGAKCYVLSAEALQVSLSLTVTKSPGVGDDVVKAAITQSVTSFLKSIAFESDFVSYAKIGEAIIKSDGVEDYKNLKVNGGTNNIDLGTKQVAVLGVVSLV